MKITTITRRFAERLLLKFGYSLKMVGAPPRGYENFLAYAKECGLNPGTIFDVGVGYGTPWLYDAFPGVHLVLIEPQAEFEPFLKQTCQHRSAEYHLVGVGETERSIPLYRLPGSPTGSSFLPPSKQAEQQWGTFSLSSDTMPIVKLDRFEDRTPPFLVKIDTEGFEREVIGGARGILEKTDLVLMEVAIMERQKGEADLIELGLVMKRHGFRLVDIPSLVQGSPKGPLLYMDVAFVRVGSEVDGGMCGQRRVSRVE